MMKWGEKLVLISLFAAGTGCATAQRQLDDEVLAGKPLARVNPIPFIEQSPKNCGPTALYMVAKPHKPDLKLEELTEITMTPQAHGTYKQDLLAATRRIGLAPYRVESVKEMLGFMAEGTPVLIFHHTKLLWRDFWHYSVLTGYNQFEQTFTVHIGPYPHREMEAAEIIQTWIAGEKWSMVALPPGRIPETAEFQEAVDNALAFLRLQQKAQASELAYAIQARWPERYEADVILAEVFFKNAEPLRAMHSLKTALRKNPTNLKLKQKVLELSRAK